MPIFADNALTPDRLEDYAQMEGELKATLQAMQ